MKRSGIVVIVVYSHIEAYPPSLNAISHLAASYSHIYVLHRNVLCSSWTYPPNITLINFGEYVPADQVYTLSLSKKLKSYFGFGKTLKALVSEYAPALLLVYDPIAFAIANVFVSRKKLKGLTFWYHNHDVMDERELSRTSLMRWMRKAELRFFHRVDYFSLPAKSRLRYFPIDTLRNPPVILPNFPSRNFFGRFQNEGRSEGVIRIVFQGQISSSNSIDEVVKILPFPVRGRTIELHVVGPVSTSYQQQLQEAAEKLNVSTQLKMYGRLPYREVPGITSSCHIGLAIYGSHNTMVKTMSTASNKIFEYASVGLPVIINEREDMREEFKNLRWIHFSHLSPSALLEAIENIMDDYTILSKSARADFEESLNFEKAFIPFLESIDLKNK